MNCAQAAQRRRHDVKKRATHVTETNEQDGFAKAMEMILKL